MTLRFHRPPCPTRSTLVVIGLVALVTVSMPWWCLNISASSPYGLYRLTALPSPLERGMLVTLPVPAEMRPWLPWVSAMLKPVAALAGDEVCVAEGTLSVQGRNYGAVYYEAHGKVLPQVVGCFVVAEEDAFLASDIPRSIDSRYFGSVSISILRAQAIPLVTWR